nr:MAG TPA: hypothetical protein [Caudoviricetes sp.]
MASHKTNTVLFAPCRRDKKFCCTVIIIADLKPEINEPVKNFHDLGAVPPVRAPPISKKERF